MSFKKDTSKVRSFSGGPIKKTGFYPFTITKAYLRKSLDPAAQSKAIHIDVVTDAGQYGSIDLWHTARNGLSTDKNGKDLPALQAINDLMVLLDIDELKEKPGKVMVYDYDLKQDVETKKYVYPELIDRACGGVWQMVESDKQVKQGDEWIPSGERKVNPEFLCFCDAETMASPAEFLNGAESISIQRYIESLDEVKNSQQTLDAHIIKQAQNQPNAPVQDAVKIGVLVDGFEDFDDDIPF